MNRSETYSLGYGPASIAMMSSRTASNHAQFFLNVLEPGMRLLDIGCGPGTVTLGLAEAVYPGEVIGSELELEQTESIASSVDPGKANLAFEIADVYQLPYDDCAFDAVFASALMGNLQRPLDALTEIIRILKPGGLIGIKEFDHSANIAYPLSASLKEANSLYNRLRILNGHDPDSGRKIKGYLNTAGFKQVKALATYQNVDIPPGKGSPLLEAMFRDEWGPEFVRHGWATQQQIDSWIEESRSRENGDDTFVATAWIEATAYKSTNDNHD